MKYLIVITMMLSAPAQAGTVEVCNVLAEFVRNTARARDEGMSMAAAQAMVREGVSDSKLASSLQETVRLVYTEGSSGSPDALAMGMFNACMGN